MSREYGGSAHSCAELALAKIARVSDLRALATPASVKVPKPSDE